ncbi:ABC transporter permease [Aldersonia sp. NBC_00410]|uniref:ABC transporter permease n=1 Tax=Aldersonia sp. NBC_00410 TaxID=2975954 RepID=UPI00225715CE|nr:ABC transporter permease [Aldersonia sp. NBC_00410]MCX5044007.1 ABC transporter permease [Aldersonia sp. NBC_00410]
MTIDFSTGYAGSNDDLQPNGFQQWRALTGRTMRTMVGRSQLFVAILIPLVFTLGYYLPLKYVMSVRGVDYAQYVMPIVVLQTMAFTMMSNAQLAAFETMNGFNERMQAMPVAALAPLGARITAGQCRSIVALAAAIGFGHVIGFRFVAGTGQAMLFCVFALAVGLVLSLGADALGVITKNPQALSQALALPTLILGMLSCGFVPATGFPEWIQPFVRNQPISQFSISMQAMTTTGVSFHVLWPSLLWLGGAAALFVPLGVWASGRRG